MTDLKTPLETPYFDRELEYAKYQSNVWPGLKREEKAKEYQQIKAALRRLETLESESKTLRNALTKALRGWKSGEPFPLDFEAKEPFKTVLND